MNEIEKRGDLASKVHCPECRKVLKEIPTAGEPTNNVIEILEFHARRHEQKHPSHEVSVIIYRATWLD